MFLCFNRHNHLCLVHISAMPLPPITQGVIDFMFSCPMPHLGNGGVMRVGASHFYLVHEGHPVLHFLRSHYHDTEQFRVNPYWFRIPIPVFEHCCIMIERDIQLASLRFNSLETRTLYARRDSTSSIETIILDEGVNEPGFILVKNPTGPVCLGIPVRNLLVEQ